MRKNLLLLCVAIAITTLLAFTLSTDPPYENLLAEEYKAELVTKSTAVLLKTNLADVFSHEFDHVEFVDIHLSPEEGYYYVAYGMKNGQAIVRMINAPEEMVLREHYPSRADMGIAKNEAVINCYCAWIFCTHSGQGKYCGIALDTMSACQPAFCKIRPKPIDEHGN